MDYIDLNSKYECEFKILLQAFFKAFISISRIPIFQNTSEWLTVDRVYKKSIKQVFIRWDYFFLWSGISK